MFYFIIVYFGNFKGGKGRTIRNPGRRGGGGQFPPKNSCKGNFSKKKFVQALRHPKKIRASKVR